MVTVERQPQHLHVSLSLSADGVQECPPAQGTPHTALDEADAGNSPDMIAPPVVLVEQPHDEDGDVDEKDELDVHVQECTLLPVVRP